MNPLMSSIPIPQTIERLCYRYPSALVDAVTDYEPGKRMVAVKNITVNEDYFQGHFPGAPLLPAVLMIETLGQVATMLGVYRAAGGYAVRRQHVRIGRNCRIGASTVIDGDTEIGDGNEIFPFASVGLIPQDLKFR